MTNLGAKEAKVEQIKVDAKKLFNTDVDFDVLAFKDADELVPKIDENYVFNPDLTRVVLAAIFNNQKMLVQGMHGTGKSTHIEQIAARLNRPVVRINFDSQITRSDLVGKDVITLRSGKQVTEFKEGVIPYCVKRPIILILDEYDAIRTDVSFVIQRLLEQDGKFALLEENQIIDPDEHFRLFATSNTLGMGDDYGIYHGTNLINQGQMDRWNIVYSLGYLGEDEEEKILLKKSPFLNKKVNKDVARLMILMANLTRESFRNGDLSNLITLRTLINWTQNYEIFGSINQSFMLTFYNKIIDDEKPILKEFFQRVFAQELV
jgi:cobaltochelatase CobS